MPKISRTYSKELQRWYYDYKKIASYREFQYDDKVRLDLKTLFPSYHSVRYTKKITQPGKNSGSIPDFALIREDYSEWLIVEVERIEDRLQHVTKQVADFSHGTYRASDQAKLLYESDNTLDFGKLKKLVQNIPKVLIIVDDLNSKWVDALKIYNPTICVIRFYKNKENGLELISISEDYPYIFEDSTFCRFTNTMKNVLTLEDSSILETYTESIKNVDENDIEPLQISFIGQITEWRMIDEKNLQAISPHALPADWQYILRRTDEDEFIIERK